MGFLNDFFSGQTRLYLQFYKHFVYIQALCPFSFLPSDTQDTQYIKMYLLGLKLTFMVS